MNTIKIIIIIINILLLINTIHFGIFAVIPFLKKKREEVKLQNKKNKFMILIAARNEELVIGNLIDSLHKLDYPKDLYNICVIPNNCLDKTKEIAIEKNCLVIEPEFIPKTKGEVLNFCFNYFKNEKFDAYVIFDADNVVDKNFLKYMNDKLNKGYKLIQGFRDTKNLYDNHIAGSYAIFFYLQNLYLYESRSRIKKNATINGTGYVVSKALIDNLPRFKTVTEDIELTCLVILNNERIGYEEKAIFYDEQVTNFKTSMIQRKRWIQGFIQVYKNYSKQLIIKIFKKPNFKLIDFYQILFLPINQALACIILIVSIFTILPIKLFLMGIIIGFIGELVVEIYLLKYYHKNIKKLWLTILFFPIFNITWMPIYIYSLFNFNIKWDEIRHIKNIKIEDFTRGDEV
ncbi:MAG: glycosyltransferase family 2 protein [Bacilli bacterium]|nr:glycosyltransferase family 2 protein [Bacilli bacterium]